MWQTSSLGQEYSAGGRLTVVTPLAGIPENTIVPCPTKKQVYYLPPCAKQTFSLGNFSKIPPIIMEQIAMVVSVGMPKNKKKLHHIWPNLEF